MREVKSEEFVDRVFTSREKVPFSFVDAYGHLSTSRYLELFINHRFSAPEEQIGLSVLSLARDLHLGLVVSEASVRFVSSAQLGEPLEIASWTASNLESGCVVVGLLVHAERRRVRATVQVEICSVDVRTGRPAPLPASWPCSIEEDALGNRPLTTEYLKGVKGLPSDFLARTPSGARGASY